MEEELKSMTKRTQWALEKLTGRKQLTEGRGMMLEKAEAEREGEEDSQEEGTAGSSRQQVESATCS
jgi:hypothetical protein